MRRAPGCSLGWPDWRQAVSRRGLLAFWITVCLLSGLPLQGCKRKAAPRAEEATGSDSSKDAPTGGREVNAAWYDVPADSLAKRRAGLEELTAAHNKLPIGTLVRVTHLANGKSVKVRITDRGIHDRHVKLDLCKEAAEELGMVGKGIARVRMEVVPQEQGSSPAEPALPSSP
jgi:Lytic transglycolase